MTDKREPMDWMTWYNGLAKPSWAPAPSTIRLIWQILYPIIVISFGFVLVQAIRRKVGGKVALLFAITRGKPDLHPHRVWAAKSAVGVNRHPGGLEHDHLHDAGNLAALPPGRRGTVAVFFPGVDRHRSSTVDHFDELVT
jgi:hypothetical protein